MAKTHRLTNLVIEEVSSVDKGAGEGVHVVLAKRDSERGLAEILKAMDFNGGLDRENVNRAVWALQDSVNSILCDDEETDKTGAVKDSIKQFQDYIAGLVPDKTEKAAMPMTKEETAALEKSIAEHVAKAAAPLAEQITKLADENAFLKMSPAHQEFAKEMSAEDKKKFAAKSEEDREKEVEAKKVAKRDALDPEIKKRLDQADEDRKVLKALQEKDEVATFAKRAKDLGLPETDGEVMRKAYGGDVEAQKALDGKIKALTAQVSTGALFTEVGKNGGGKDGASAYDELKGKAEELRKTADGSKLSPQQAFAKVYEDPANADLVKRYKTEDVTKRAAAAA